MRYALMERWNDCTHTFIFGFGEMTLTPVDYTAITGLGFDGPSTPLDARYQTAALGAQLVRTLLGVTTQTRYTVQGCVSYEVVYRFWADWIRTRLAAWRELPVDARPDAAAYTREERDQAARSFLFYIISSQLLCTSQNKGDPAVLACLRDLSRVGSYSWGSLALAHLYHGLDVWTRGSVRAYEYRIYPGGPGGDASADSQWIPRYLAHCHHTFSSSEDPYYWRCFLNDRALSDLDPEHATHVPAQRYQELYRRFGFARSYIAQLYSKRHERDLEIGRLRRHQSRQSSAVTRLQMEVDRLLKVKGIPLDFSEDEEDDDGSSSDDAPPSPPPQAAAGPSRR
ncbi:hypothetical protein JCGZ_16261 [Jatropha curcas]|uniref:Aminotransferase-like plant mobile domain-containing protein n=1 Tax=Jatropha curcas TaxID=180498 RepID=A0A067LB18_JATCU|nr:hypothetical protein JCGZ_16261 [Jatropha curcas]